MRLTASPLPGIPMTMYGAVGWAKSHLLLTPDDGSWKRPHMTQWLHDRHGQAKIMLDSDCFRDSHGRVAAWIQGINVYTLNGHHTGWFERGVLYDSQNRALAFLRDATGQLPGRPGLGGTPGTPGFAGRPGRPGLSGTPGRPGYGGWSAEDLETYFAR